MAIPKLVALEIDLAIENVTCRYSIIDDIDRPTLGCVVIRALQCVWGADQSMRELTSLTSSQRDHYCPIIDHAISLISPATRYYMENSDTPGVTEFWKAVDRAVRNS